MNDEIYTPEPSDSTPVSDQSHKPSFWKQYLGTPKRKLLAAVVVLVVVLGVLTSQVYSRPVTDDFVRTLAQIIPYPALSVNRETITIKEFLIEYDALLGYFQDLEQQAPPDDQLEVAIADTLINKIAIRELAKEYDVELDRERVDAYYAEIVAGQESEEAFEQNLEDTFGWTSQEFEERIVESIVLALQMTDMVLENEELQASREALAQAAYQRVVGGEGFAAVAKDVHGGFDGVESDLGYVKASVIPDSWSSQVNALEEGEMTEVILLPEGYVIFRLEEKIVAGEDTQLHLLSITVPKVTLEEIVDEYLESANVKRYVGEL
jgi:parvulin-like peptidyl-prolyl isomerase